MFLKKKDKFISLVLKHIGTSALMDLLLRLVSCVEPAGLRQEVLRVSVWALLLAFQPSLVYLQILDCVVVACAGG